MAEAETSPKDTFRECLQVGVVVRDMERSIKYLSEIFGIGPFRVIEWPPKDRTNIQKRYYDEPGNFTARMAFTALGPIELELIQPLDGESIWADFLDEHGEGIHHIRFNTTDHEAVIGYLAEQGIRVAQLGSGLRPGTVWVNFDTQSKVGFTIEIMKAIAGTDGKTPDIVDGKVVA